MTSYNSNEAQWNEVDHFDIGNNSAANLNPAQTGGGGLSGSQYNHTKAAPATQQPFYLPIPVEQAILDGALNTPQPGQTTHYGSFQENGSFKAVPEERYDTEYAPSRMGQGTQRQVQQQTVPVSLYTTPSGHKRGPLNGGCVFPSTRPMPPLIPNFRPTVYTGPRATVKGTQWTHNTAGKPVQYNIYSTMADDFLGFASGYEFSYDTRGRLSDHVLFDDDTWATFLQCHPLKKSLGLFLEKNPANCKGFSLFTQDHPTYNKCRYRHCASKEKGGRGFHDGTIRIAIDEVVGRVPYGERFKNNPYFCAGYLHIDCLERMMDIGQLIRCGMLRPRTREPHPYDPHTSKTEPQVLCPPAKLVTCFEEFCKRILQYHWEGYLYNQADYLTTHAWLSVQKKGKKSTHDAPSDMKKENAQELLSRRPVDPNWGGGRRPGLAMKTVKKAEAAGRKDQLVGPGTGRDSERAQTAARRIKDEIEHDISGDDYQTGEVWLRDCYIPLNNPELYHDGFYLTPPPPSDEPSDSHRTLWGLFPWEGVCRGPPQQREFILPSAKKRKRTSAPSATGNIGTGRLNSGYYSSGGSSPSKIQKQDDSVFDSAGYFPLPPAPLAHEQDVMGDQSTLKNVYPPIMSPAVRSQLLGFTPAAPQSRPDSPLLRSLQEEFFPQMGNPPPVSYGNNQLAQTWQASPDVTQLNERWQDPGMQGFDFGFPDNEPSASAPDSSFSNELCAMQDWEQPGNSNCIDPVLLQLSPPSGTHFTDLRVSDEERRLLGEGWLVEGNGENNQGEL